ncbi:unnamed protein product [Clavelina lepadiformis]|uniref:Uncharacterized protein n=1 Tax=Clavelina lepadiformis TaxID=159417 RepID=A0ABP0FXW5_CLALP
MASSDYDRKIKQLFEEGRKLGASGLIEAGNTDSNAVKLTSSKPTIDVLQLQAELEKQRKETNQLQQDINAAKYRINKTGQVLDRENVQTAPGASYQDTNACGDYRSTSTPSRNFNSNNNVVANYGLGKVHSEYIASSTEMSALTKNKIYLENVLEDAQAQIEYLTRKLDESKESGEQQKEHFRRAIEELQRKLQETVAGRKKLMDLRQQDMDQQEEMIHNLQTTLKELAASNQMQEQALLDAHERMEILENRNQSNERAMSRIKIILGNMFQKEAGNSKSNRYFENDHLTDMLPDLLVDSFERFLKNATDESDCLRKQVLQLEAEQHAAKQSHDAERLVASSDAADMIRTLKLEQEKLLNDEKCRSQKAEELLSAMTNEVKQLQMDNNAQTRLAEDFRQQAAELNKQLDEARREHCDVKGDLQSRVVSLEYDVRSSNDLAQRVKGETAVQLQSITELQTRLQETLEELQTEREQRKALWVKDNESSREINELRSQVEDKSLEISRLREIAAQLRGDLTTRVAKEINEAENAERKKAEDKIEAISRENVSLREEVSRVRASLEATERQIADGAMERNGALQMLKEKDQQVERLTTQLGLTDRKLVEAIGDRKNLEENLKTLRSDYNDLTRTAKSSKSDLERTRSVANDKERISMQLRHQLETKTEHLKSAVQEAEVTNVKNKRLEDELKEVTAELQKSHDLVKSKEESLADYESRMSALNEEKCRISSDVQNIQVQVKNMMQSKQELTSQLKEAGFQVNHLIEERDLLTKELKTLQARYRDETGALKKELRHKKRDLHHTQESLQAMKSVDGKAAQIAADMQVEVTDKRAVIDSLQTELSKAYDKLELEQRETKHHKKECARLQKDVDDVTKSLKKTEEELRNKSKTEKGYRLGVERLQMALEKAAVRNAEAQMLINKQENEMSKANIQRNLDLMDKRIPSMQIPQAERASGAYGRTTSQPHNYVVLQNMLARIMTTMAPSRDATVSGSAQASLVNLAKADQRQAKYTSLPADEIYKVLAEVRDHLASRDSRPDVRSRKSKQKSLTSRKKQKIISVSSDDESSATPILMVHSNATVFNSTSRTTTFDDDTISDVEQHPTECHKTSSPFKAGVDFEGERPPSPVSILLGAGDSLHVGAKKPRTSTSPARILQESNVLSPDHDVYDIIRKEKAREKMVSAAISDNAEELCRQLQSRLEGLSKMGGRLEKQNQDTAKLIKKQERKLHQVRNVR